MRPSKREIFLLKGETRTVFGVELREPPPMFEDELIFSDQEWLEGISLVPGYHISLQLHYGKNTSDKIINNIIIIMYTQSEKHGSAHERF